MSVVKVIVCSRRPWAVLAVVGLLLGGGCGQGGYSGPMGTVRGTVTLNGQPVPVGCSVSFVSDDGFTASGQVTAGGAYELSVAGTGKDIPAATYKVCVLPPSDADADAAETSSEGEDYEKMMDASAESGGKEKEEPAQEKEVIPAKYRATSTSGLSFPVKEGGNTIAIELE